ncbi:MAG TPA: hypothetical protein VEK15_24235 [Vicinamibacteria bacterium]|nr:hypothetical protein [Vicinamibacteria bacterium]
MTRKRLAAAIEVDADLFAPELLDEAETFLAKAELLARDRATYRASIRAAAHACLRADEAFAKARAARRTVVVRLERLLHELDGLLDMAASRGARSTHGDELFRLRARYEAVRDIKNVLTAMEEASALKPELLAFERRFRPRSQGESETAPAR